MCNSGISHLVTSDHFQVIAEFQFCKGVKGLINFSLDDIEVVIGYKTPINSYNDKSIVNKAENGMHDNDFKAEREHGESNSSSSMLSRFMQYIASSFVWWVLVG